MTTLLILAVLVLGFMVALRLSRVAELTLNCAASGKSTSQSMKTGYPGG